MRRWKHAPRLLLVVALVFFGLAKIVGGWTQAMPLAEVFYYLIAIGELGVAVLLIAVRARMRQIIYWAIAVLSAVAVLVDLAAGPAGCGCAGPSLVMTERARQIVLGCFGLLAVCASGLEAGREEAYEATARQVVIED